MTGPARPLRATEGPSLRIDKWLWHARFFKSRSLAAKMVSAKRLRVSGQLIDKAHFQVRAGDVLTFPQGDRIRVVRILDLGTRRGPATEAQTLYEDLKPPPDPAVRKAAAESARLDSPAPAARRPEGAGRPTKRDRRQLDRFREKAGEDLPDDEV
ncbi:MAG: RNA-binding S4 domain-containing protein [Rhodovibrionaceae bacterium]|nr:RNA-binding S4 domain-containing protein [Rhodovibrionaceae bacterium]